MGESAFSFDDDSWRLNMPLTFVDYAKDPNVKAALVIFYRNTEDEPTDQIDTFMGAEEEVSAFTMIGALDVAKNMIMNRNLGGEDDG